MRNSESSSTRPSRCPRASHSMGPITATAVSRATPGVKLASEYAAMRPGIVAAPPTSTPTRPTPTTSTTTTTTNPTTPTTTTTSTTTQPTTTTRLTTTTSTTT